VGLGCWKTAIVGSNVTRSMDMCPCCAVLCK
jgi:hypothetical protein